jgi:isopentenyl diphosphate isomerase/L-lactate dehydrogenase-like FMN-dependent dehydrogenase
MGGHLGIFSIADARRLAQKRLPRMIFNYVDGAASDEKAAQLNMDRLSDLRLMPRVLRNVVARRLTGQILGMDVGLPFGIAPMGMCNLSWPGGDRALARLAATRQIPLCVSTAASTPLETMIEMAEGHAWFQLYVGQSDAFVSELVDRAEAAGYTQFILTVDVPVLSMRNRERSTGFGHPPRMDVASIIDFACHPRWVMSTLRAGIPKPMNFHRSAHVSSFDRTANRAGADWGFLKRLRDRWPHKLIIKGVQSPDDARRITKMGVDAIYVSNHGGRQLNAAPAVISSLPQIRNAVGHDMVLIFDGGVRRGEDIIKARAAGADFVMVGRPFLYGLGAAGEKGIHRITDILAEEADITMGLIGETELTAIGSQNLAM